MWSLYDLVFDDNHHRLLGFFFDLQVVSLPHATPSMIFSLYISLCLFTLLWREECSKSSFKNFIFNWLPFSKLKGVENRVHQLRRRLNIKPIVRGSCHQNSSIGRQGVNVEHKGLRVHVRPRSSKSLTDITALQGEQASDHFPKLSGRIIPFGQRSTL